MALTRKDRFNMKTQLLEGLGTLEWDPTRVNVLLREFELQPFTGQFDHPSLDEIIADVTDEKLTELYSVVMGVDIDAVVDVVESVAGDGVWKPDYARVFLSHSAKHKKFVGEVADELALVGIHGFVAHDTMAFSKPWQSQIEQSLRSMQAFVAIIHPEFNSSLVSARSWLGTGPQSAVLRHSIRHRPGRVYRARSVAKRHESNACTGSHHHQQLGLGTPRTGCSRH